MMIQKEAEMKEVFNIRIDYLINIAFTVWINSLSIDDVNVNNLYEDLKDGLVLLKIMDQIKPGCVDWKKADIKPSNKFKKILNANYSVEVGKSLKFSLVGIGGMDIVEGNKKLILSFVS